VTATLIATLTDTTRSVFRQSDRAVPQPRPEPFFSTRHRDGVRPGITREDGLEGRVIDARHLFGRTDGAVTDGFLEGHHVAADRLEHGVIQHFIGPCCAHLAGFETRLPDHPLNLPANDGPFAGDSPLVIAECYRNRSYGHSALREARMDTISYSPTDIPPQEWAEVGPFVRQAVLTAQKQSAARYTTKDLMGHVAAHVHWCRTVACLPLDVSVIFDRDVISESTQRGFPGLKTTTRATRRSALLRVAESVLPQPERTSRLAPLRDDKLALPYTEDEQVALRSWAMGQTTPNRRRDCHTILALGLGAGLPAPDILRLRARHVIVDGQGVLLRVEVSRHPREVPVLWSWEQPLLDMLATRDPEELVVGVERQEGNANWLNYFISRTNAENGLKPDSRRLRNTWLLHHLGTGTPLGPLAHAAGLETFRSIEKLFPLLPQPTRDEVRRLMRRPLRTV